MINIRSLVVLAGLLAAIHSGPAVAESIVLASTTSVENSGLLADIIPPFTAKTGISVHVVAQGTGKALDTALKAIAAAKASFVSRGDNSGTNTAERRLWKSAGLAPGAGEKWYRDIGGSLGQALNAASAIDAYTLTDRGTWLSFANKGSLLIAVEGDPRLINRYNVIELDPQKHAGAKLTPAKVFADWLVSREGQEAIGAYRVNGERLFNPSADAPK